jgi:hypothetical protein
VKCDRLGDREAFDYTSKRALKNGHIKSNCLGENNANEDNQEEKDKEVNELSVL